MSFEDLWVLFFWVTLYNMWVNIGTHHVISCVELRVSYDIRWEISHTIHFNVQSISFLYSNINEFKRQNYEIGLRNTSTFQRELCYEKLLCRSGLLLNSDWNWYFYCLVTNSKCSIFKTNCLIKNKFRFSSDKIGISGFRLCSSLYSTSVNIWKTKQKCT